MTMRMNNFRAILKAATLSVAALLLTASASFAQQQVNLTAAPTTATMPDGTTVPMWGYSCGAAVTAVTSTAATTYSPTGASDTSLTMPTNAYAGTTVTAGTSSGTVLSNTATTLTLTSAGWTGGTPPASGTAFSLAASSANCAALNKAAGTGWSPFVITVPTGQGLTINLTNNLAFLNGNTVPTSLVIVGQLGGGLGTTATSKASPDHSALPSNSVSWPIAGGPGFTPPTQGPRVQSFSTEVAVGAT